MANDMTSQTASTPPIPKRASARNRVMESASWYHQQKSVLADVTAQRELREAEMHSLAHEVEDLVLLESAIRQGMILIDGSGEPS
jgi:hypothetical protein